MVVISTVAPANWSFLEGRDEKSGVGRDLVLVFGVCAKVRHESDHQIGITLSPSLCHLDSPLGIFNFVRHICDGDLSKNQYGVHPGIVASITQYPTKKDRAMTPPRPKYENVFGLIVGTYLPVLDARFAC